MLENFSFIAAIISVIISLVVAIITFRINEVNNSEKISAFIKYVHMADFKFGENAFIFNEENIEFYKPYHEKYWDDMVQTILDDFNEFDDRGVKVFVPVLHVNNGLQKSVYNCHVRIIDDEIQNKYFPIITEEGIKEVLNHTAFVPINDIRNIEYTPVAIKYSIGKKTWLRNENGEISRSSSNNEIDKNINSPKIYIYDITRFYTT